MKHPLRLLLLAFALLPMRLTAQNIIVQAPSTVYQGDNFTVRFVINDQVKDFRGPDFKGFSLRSGPNQSRSTSMSFVNGQRSSSTTTTFSYTLVADGNPGQYTIGSASCVVDGQTIRSESVSISVEQMSNSVKQQRAQQQQQQRQAFDPWAEQPMSAASVDEQSLFARASVSKTNPYQGEQVIVTYKIYTQVPVQQYAIDKLPGNRGFWAEDLSVGQQIKQYEETIDGRHYMVAEIRRGALYAQESGKLSIEPLDLTVLAVVQQQRRRTGSIWDLFDDAFFNSRQAVEKPLRTQRINLDVKPLPSAPASFGGAVGKFDIKGGLNLDHVKANEAVSYKITLSGTGNLMLVNAPQPEFPSVFEAYDPQMTDNLQKSDNGVSGSRTYEWVLIPRSAGSFTIPELDFTFFDPTTGTYTTRHIAAQSIKVDKSDSRMTDHSDTPYERDIEGLYPTSHLRPLQTESHASWLFYALLGLVAAATVGIIAYIRHQREAEKDVAGMRLKRANREARRRLKRAAAYLSGNDTERFYEEIYKALWGCLADKYNINLAQLNRDTVSSCLTDKAVPQQQHDKIMSLLQDVDMARFAPVNPENQKQTIYSEALEVIASL